MKKNIKYPILEEKLIVPQTVDVLYGSMPPKEENPKEWSEIRKSAKEDLTDRRL